MSDVWRVTVKRGRDRRVLVFEEPWPQGRLVKVGDTQYLKEPDGSIGKPWTVTKIEKTELLAKIPIGRKA